MASTTFVDGETLIEASWLNDVNAAVYTPGTVTAADIANVPNTGSGGNISATDVQAAINELDSEKQPLDALLTALAAQTTSANTIQAYSGADTPTLLTTGTASGTVPLWESLLLNGALSKASAYEVAATDRGKLIDATTGTWSLTIAAGVLSAGFAFAVRNSGTGTITINPVFANIDGASTIDLAAGESCLVVANAGDTEWKTVGRTVSLPEATASVDGYMTSTYAAKLDTIAENANVGVPVDVCPTANIGAVAVGGFVYAYTGTANVNPGTAYAYSSINLALAAGTWRSMNARQLNPGGGGEGGLFQRIA